MKNNELKFAGVWPHWGELSSAAWKTKRGSERVNVGICSWVTFSLSKVAMDWGLAPPLRYPLTNEAIRKFVSKLNRVAPCRLRMVEKIETLHQQEYKGKNAWLDVPTDKATAELLSFLSSLAWIWHTLHQSSILGITILLGFAVVLLRRRKRWTRFYFRSGMPR